MKPFNEIVRVLQQLLTRQLTAHIAGIKDGKSVTRWASGETKEVRNDSEQHLRAAYECVVLLSSLGAESIAKAWFIGQNPFIDDISPAQALNEGKIKEVRLAARAFLGGGEGI